MSGNFNRPRSGPQLPELNLNLTQIITAATAALAALLVVYVLVSGIYKVAEYQEAVVLRWGKYHQTVGPGLHLKLPWIDEAVVLNTDEKSLRLPWGTTEENEPYSPLRSRRAGQQEESLILTADLYAAVVEWNVMWRISEPKDFVLHFGDIETLENTIRGLARSTMHQAVGDYSAEEVLTDKRDEVRLAAMQDMVSQLARLNAGVTITQIQMQRVIPPERVKPAFDKVNASIQHRDQLVYEARLARNELLPAAQANSDRLIREAEGYAARRLAESEGEINALLAKYESYKAAPEVTRQRMYLEAMEKVLSNSGPKTIIDSDIQGMLPLLNLNETN